jgi:hypothetical protein
VQLISYAHVARARAARAATTRRRASGTPGRVSNGARAAKDMTAPAAPAVGRLRPSRSRKSLGHNLRSTLPALYCVALTLHHFHTLRGVHPLASTLFTSQARAPASESNVGPMTPSQSSSPAAPARETALAGF